MKDDNYRGNEQTDEDAYDENMQEESGNIPYMIREMQLDDVNPVYAIERESFSEKWNVGSFLYSINAKSDYCIVAEYEGEVAGFAIIRSSFETADVANIAVAKRYRRRGIGEELVKHLLEYGLENGIADFVLEVRESNFPAIALYKKMGFNIEGLRKNYYGNPTEDALVMWRRGQIYA